MKTLLELIFENKLKFNNMKMQYIGDTIHTIKQGEICELIAIKRIPIGSSERINFPSGIKLAFRKTNGNTLFWCNPLKWRKI